MPPSQPSRNRAASTLPKSATHWSKLGHYKIAELACYRVREPALARLLQLNVDRITAASALPSSEFVHAAQRAATAQYCALADVPDLVWKRGGESVREHEGPNHFANLDQPSPLYAGATLLELTRAGSFLDPTRWKAFYDSLDIEPARQGLLPFRVWQLFDVMSAALQRDHLVEFVAAAGVLAHYVGDACQPLHGSYLHDGDPRSGRGRGVHNAYETTMIQRYSAELSIAVSASRLRRPQAVRDGHGAARSTLSLMRRSLGSVPPTELIEAYERTQHGIAELWAHFGDRTAVRLLDGGTVLAVMWESAWNLVGAHRKSVNTGRPIELDQLRRFYLDRHWAPSVRLDEMRVEDGELKV